MALNTIYDIMDFIMHKSSSRNYKYDGLSHYSNNTGDVIENKIRKSPVPAPGTRYQVPGTFPCYLVPGTSTGSLHIQWLMYGY